MWYADVVLNPLFPEKELHRLKLQRLAQLKARADDPERTAAAVFPRLPYGLDHPYGRPDVGTPASVQSITRDDALAFYKRIMVPNNAACGRRRHPAGFDRGRARSPLEDLATRPGPARTVCSSSNVAAPRGCLPDRQAGRLPVGLEGGQKIWRVPANRPISLD